MDWERILKTLISDTAKDFTIMLKIEEKDSKSVEESEIKKNQIEI